MIASKRLQLLAAAGLLAGLGLALYVRHERALAAREAVRSQWSIDVWEGPTPLQLHPRPSRPSPVLSARDVTDVAAEFVADPFLLQKDSRWYLFFEVMESRRQKGSIGVAISSDGGQSWQYDRIVLREPFHLSYPYVFQRGSDIYMVPESSETGSVRLYRAVHFPYEWALERTLLSGLPFVDSSLFQYRDKWWMFTSTPENNQLLLYFADALEGPWSEHPASPVVRRDPHIARPGGRVLVLGDRILRFAQDDAPKYGIQVFAFDVIELDATTYREVPAGDGPIVAASGSGWNRDRMHTVDAHMLAPDRWMASVDGKGVLPKK